MWSQWYKMRAWLAWAFLVASVLLVAVFVYFASRTARSLEREERAKMELWADAYQHLFLAGEDTDMSLELNIINGNTTIPVFYTEADGTLLGYNNLSIPVDTAAFIARKVAELRARGNYFEIDLGAALADATADADSDAMLAAGTEHDDATLRLVQYLYYDESTTLQMLQYYPYIQLMVIVVFVLLFYYFFASRKRFEQNRVWVGLSRETAHQLGTPISSLMGWMEILKAEVGPAAPQPTDVAAQAVGEMDKDIERLQTVAERFSKIGSTPQLEPVDLIPLVRRTADYMQKRAPVHVAVTADVPVGEAVRPLSEPLFAWVLENLCRNAIDAMKDGQGHITLHLTTGQQQGRATIDVEDDGCGIPKSRQKDIFRAGYTTKRRGWGLGLTLVRRIVEEYHHGRIYVLRSAPGEGTTFRIEI